MESIQKLSASGKEALAGLMEQGKKAGNKHISFSEFGLYNNCGHKHLIFKYLALDSEPPSIHLAFGDAIHAVLESTIENDLSIEERTEFFRERFQKNMDETMKGQPAYADLKDFMEQGCHILTILDVRSLLEEYEVISVEEPLYEQIYDKFYFKGFIDLVLRHRITGRYLVVDWKSSSEPWNLSFKLNDRIFLMQMKLYKYFWARKNGVTLDDIDLKYMVLNRLKNKRKPDLGFGDVQEVPMSGDLHEIKEALELVAKTVKAIHIDKTFKKAKIVVDANGKPIMSERFNGPKLDFKPCIFCKFKDGKHPLCNSNFSQDKVLLKEHGRI